MNTIISQILTFFGIAQAPTTVSELLWDLVILFVGFYVVKWVTVTVFSLMKDMIKAQLESMRFFQAALS